MSVRTSIPFAVAGFAFALSGISLAQTNVPSGISVQFSEREYQQQGYPPSYTRKGLAASAFIYSQYNSSVSWNVPLRDDLAGRFTTLEGGSAYLYGLLLEAGVSANILKGTISDKLVGNEVSFDFEVYAIRRGSYVEVPYLGPQGEVPHPLLSSGATVSCELKIVSDGPFLWETITSFTNSTAGLGEDNIQAASIMPAGTYYVSFGAGTTGPTWDFNDPQLQETNSKRVRFNLTKVNVGAPRVASFNKAQQQFSINWNDEWNRAVRIQRSSSLNSTNWENIGFGAIGQKSFVDTNAPIGSAFYRLVW